MNIKKILLIIMTLIVTNIMASNQINIRVPNDPAGDPGHLKSGFMDGNRVYLQFRNTTELGDCCNRGYPVAIWPNNYDGTKSHDGIWFQIGAQVFLDTINDVVIESMEEARNMAGIDTLYFVQTHTREQSDTPPEGGFKWAIYPVGGYLSLTTETPAMSDKPESWPELGWPAVGKDGNDTLIYQNSWNGRFGQDIFKADLSCYFVANDAQDLEKIREPRFEGSRYYPRPGVKIGDIDPNVSVQNGMDWGGIGVRVATRGYQWANPQAQDAIFFEYNVTNISDYDLPSMWLGYEADNAVGGEEYVGADDVAYYRILEEVNMCFVWDHDFIPVGGGKEPGVIGFAFLESPGLENDGVDNDKDGLIDEKRHNTVEIGELPVGPFEGIDNLEDFLAYYDYDEGYTQEELELVLGGHFLADEDKDWQDWIDSDEDGEFDMDEPIGDDVGTDGIGPYDIWYTGPDANGTECNHKPDCIIGLGSEPNFGTTDVSETDLLGLQNFNYICGEYKYNGWGCSTWGSCNDEKNFQMHYERITQTPDAGEDKYHAAQVKGLNFHHAFSSGMFKMDRGSTERMSLAELHAYDALAGLEAADPQAPALTRLAEVVNKIYEADYRFAQPPVMPELHAVPGDGKIYLSWDDQSERLTREVMLMNKNDFEGYKLYRATDKQLSDPMLITDLNGGTVFRQPIFQCDLNNGKVGPTPYGQVNGTGYNLGNDSGIKHSFVDSTVQNGRKYYYALVAYDYGLPNVGLGISPSENKITIRKNEAEQVIDISKNVAIVVPFQKAAGYVPAGIDSLDYETEGTGYAFPKIITEDQVLGGHTYKVKFQVQEKTLADVSGSKMFWNDGMKIYDVTDNDELVYEENYKNYPVRNIRPFLDITDEQSFKYKTGSELESDIFEGLIIRYYMPTAVPAIDKINSNWRTGSGDININDASINMRYFCNDFEVIFGSGSNTSVTTGTVISSIGNEIPNSELLFNANIPFYVSTLSGSVQPALVVHDLNGNGTYDINTDKVLVGAPKDNGTEWGTLIFTVDFIGASSTPSSGDSYFVTFNKGFTSDDEILFKVTGNSEFDKKQLSDDMKDIKVVPNPYVITNNMEPAVMNEGFNQRRRILFTHIPAKCTIKIFTISGILVDELKVDNATVNVVDETDVNSIVEPISNASNGIATWDVLTKEGLEVSAGYYIYQVKSDITGKEKIGKFAIIK